MATAQPAVAGELEQYRRELTGYCYRMLGSAFDAEDAVQETMLRAWRSLDRFEGRSALKSWLYRIATNVCFDALAGRERRARPMDLGPAQEPLFENLAELPEVTWITPLPTPDELAEQRETLRLAFVAALQHLPPNQRAVLILREVLGFSAKEVAEALDTTTASVNSALQRARASVEERTPEQTQQATLRALGDEKLKQIVDRYVEAWENCDVDTVVAMLSEDVSFAMPPLASWFHGRESLSVFLAGWPLSGDWRWRPIPVRANGQPALAFYTWDEDEQAYVPFALNVLTLRGEQISDVVAFVNRAVEATEREAYHRWVDEPTDAERLHGTFERFGLPARIEA